MNLLYVAVTRAINKLYIYSDDKHNLCTLICNINQNNYIINKPIDDYL